MKFLIAFALFAVAFAAEEVRVVHLPAARAPSFSPIDITPLIVPQSVIDALKFADVTINRDAEAEIDSVRFVDSAVETVKDDLKVRFVDAAVDAPVENFASETEQDFGKVIVVDAPVQALASENEQDFGKIIVVDAPVETDAEDSENIKIFPQQTHAEALEASLKLRVVEPVEAAENVDALKVRFVDAPVQAEEGDALKVRFVDAPVQAEETIEAVRIAEPALPSLEAVKVGVPRYPGKLNADPKLR